MFFGEYSVFFSFENDPYRKILLLPYTHQITKENTGCRSSFMHSYDGHFFTCSEHFSLSTLGRPIDGIDYSLLIKEGLFVLLADRNDK